MRIKREPTVLEKQLVCGLFRHALGVQRVIRLEGGVHDGKHLEVEAFPRRYRDGDDVYVPKMMLSKHYAVYAVEADARHLGDAAGGNCGGAGHRRVRGERVY